MIERTWFVWFAIIINATPCRPDRSKKCGMLYLTITAESQNLAFNWVFTCSDHPDTVILYQKLTKEMRMFEELTRVLVGYGRRKGHVDTGYKWSLEKFPGNWNYNDMEEPTDLHCFPYYIASMKNGEHVDWDCLHIQPDWMKNFGSLRIAQMFIPGSYRSAAIETNMPLDRSKYQGFQFWGQLVFGIRYFDINIGHFDNRFHIIDEGRNPNIHSSVLQHLKDVAKFLKRSKNEVVILDFRNFASFSERSHDKLIRLLLKVFKRMLAPTTMNNHKFGPRLEELWETNQRVIINYRDNISVDDYPFLWNEIKTKDSNTTTVKSLENYINENARDHRHDKIACNMLAVAKPSWHVTTNKIEQLADMVNTNLSKWLHSKSLLNNINIMSVSHFDSSRIVDDAIEANEKKHFVP